MARLLARGLDRALGPFNCAIPLAERGEIDRARPQRPAVIGLHLQVPLDVGHGGFQGLARGLGATHGEIGLPEETRRLVPARLDRKTTCRNSSHTCTARMPSSA